MSNRKQLKATRKMDKKRPKKYSGKEEKSVKNENIKKLKEMLEELKN